MSVAKDSIKNKITRGDFIIVAEVLEENSAALRARFRRDNVETVLIMKKYLKEKNKLKNNLKRVLNK
jgi:hypothetical protein